MQARGMITIEASILVPIIFMTLVGMLYISFYLHDMTVARSVLGSLSTEEDLRVSLEEKLLIGMVEQVDVEEQLFSVKKTAKITFSVLFFNIEKEEYLKVSIAKNNFLEEIRRTKVFENKKE
jgi:hypothetical protein